MWTSGLRALFFVSNHNYITTRCHFQACFSFLLTHIFCLISLCREMPRLHLPSLYTFLHLTLPSLSPSSSLYFSDGMCSCCCLLFPIAVFASQHGDFGIAAELRCHGSGLCCRTVYTWDLESLSLPSLPLSYLFHRSLRFSLV